MANANPATIQSNIDRWVERPAASAQPPACLLCCPIRLLRQLACRPNAAVTCVTCSLLTVTLGQQITTADGLGLAKAACVALQKLKNLGV